MIQVLISPDISPPIKKFSKSHNIDTMLSGHAISLNLPSTASIPERKTTRPLLLAGGMSSCKSSSKTPTPTARRPSRVPARDMAAPSRGVEGGGGVY
jgi:hypothetical protein